MNEPSWMKGPPKAILLATDLSARCDRALDRAAALAAQWQARLVILHALEPALSDFAERPAPSWRRLPDPLSVARRRVQADLGVMAAGATVVIAEGDAADAILRTAEAEGCDLIVTGVVRDELLGRFSLGGTVDRLIRQSRTPVLVVKNRMRAPYRDILVATDFSASSRHALEAAARLFPDRRLTVFHAYETPLAGRMADSTAYQQELGKLAARECEDFLQDMDKIAPGWQAPKVLIENGQPDQLLRDYVYDHDLDLIVLGSHGRSALFEAFIGSVAKRIMDGLPCDALIIRDPRATTKE